MSVVWLHVICGFICVVCATASVLKLHGADVDVEILALEQEMNTPKDGCIKTEHIVECDDEPEDNMVPSGSLCFERHDDFGEIRKTPIICDGSKWKSNFSKADTDRHRRSHPSCSTSCRSVRRWGRRRRRCTQTCITPNHVPSFGTCPKRFTMTTPAKSTSMIVTWNPPVATDVDGPTPSVIQTSGVVSGSTFTGSSTGQKYHAYYWTKDGNGATATCEVILTVRVITCSIPDSPDNGAVSCPSGYNYGQQCTFTCFAGYSPTIQTVTCLSNGQWSDGGISECRAFTCPQQLPVIDNGFYTCANYTYGSTCNASCLDDYSMAANYPVACNKNGEWTVPPTAICTDANPPTLIGCPTDSTVTAAAGVTSAMVTWNVPTAIDAEDDVPPPVHQTVGSLKPGMTIEGGATHKVAYRAFDTSGNPSDECSFNVQVNVIQCPSVIPPTKGTYNCDLSTIYGSQCTFSCQPGYQMHGSSSIQCEQTGTWSAPVPTCTQIVCLTPDFYGHLISNGFYECPSVIPYQSSCAARCNTEFQLKQQVTATCLVDSNNNPVYSIPNIPECLDKEPPTFPACVQDTVIPLEAISGTRSAYVHYTVPTAVDNHDTTPTVTVIGPAIGDMIDADTVTTVSFQATDSAGNPSTLCTYKLHVEVIECPVYIPPTHGDITCTVDNVYGSVCTLMCNDGYRVDGNDQTECLADTTWTVTDLTCVEKNCATAPTDPANGIFDCAGPPYPFNMICLAQCDAGFKLTQSSYARCMADQTWSISNTPECIDSTRPEFIDCVNQLSFTADIGLTSAIVSWPIPTAVDNVDDPPVVNKISGPSPGERIEGSATVQYQAYDTAGNPSEICYMDIQVEVIQCQSPVWPSNGRVTCDLGSLYGSTCLYTCDEGYVVSEPSTVECLQNRTWSYGFQPPTCTEITCDEVDLPNVTNGMFFCLSTSFCLLSCDSGYSTTGNTPVMATCQPVGNIGEWVTTAAPECQDSTPPILTNCIQYQTLGTDYASTTTTANWIRPNATDNENTPGDIIIDQISGPVYGSVLSVGQYVIEYTATDTSGNLAIRSCSISLSVEEVKCLDPKFQIGSTGLLFNCPSFGYGSNCTLSCSVADSLTLVGANIITCEKTFWDYEGNVAPYCEPESCPKNLNVPVNGALAYPGDELAVVTCNVNYDLQNSFNGMVYCYTDSQTWSVNPVPECTEAKHPFITFLPAELTYNGDCNDPAVKEEILSKVVAVMATELTGTAYELDCMVSNTCGYDDITIECGTIAKRSAVDRFIHFIFKRQASSVKVKLNLQAFGAVTSMDNYMSADTTLTDMYNMITSMVVDGRFDTSAYTVSAITRDTYSNIKCSDPNYVQDGFSCKSCAEGYFMDNVGGTMECTKCPVGSYKDNDSGTNCTLCPPGKSTFQVGAMSSDMCLDICPVGASSVSGLWPCTECQKGYFKNITGQGECIQCDIGQTTFATGQASCSNYDATFSGAQTIEINRTVNDIDAFTLMFWVKKDCASYIGTEFGSVLTINISSVISTSGTPVFTPYCDVWTNVAVAVDSTGCTLYINGDMVASTPQPAISLLPADSSIKLTYDTMGGEIDVSSYAIFPAIVLDSGVIGSYQSSCYPMFDTAIVTSDDLIHRYDGIDVNPPSCIDSNQCLDTPCGSHLCTPTVDGFVCTCSDGYTGLTCEILPDFCNTNDCKNDATCVSGNDSYTCLCTDGYRGRFCQTPSVIPGWGAWSDWTTCTALCDGGTQNRTRVCDNPVPEVGGAPCSGESVELIDCNVMSCLARFPCSSNPCIGNATCLSTSTGYICECSSGYTDVYCDTVINNCDPNPCNNGGTCVNMVADFQCVCPTEYSGDVCENEPSSDSYWSPWSPCNATCDGGISTRYRVCSSNVTCAGGDETKTCNQQPCPVDYCLSNECIHGECVSGVDDFSCICETGYEGTTCNTPINFCESNPCVRGQCTNTGMGYSCECPQGFIGTLCDMAADNGQWGEWSSWSICNVTCGPGVSQRSRLCDNPVPGPNGLYCEGSDTETTSCQVQCYNECASNPCADGHDCVEEGNSFTCYCKHGFSGSTCLTPPDVCQPNPCMNGGLCRGNGNTPVCDCINGYSGVTCNVDPADSVWEPWALWSSCSATCDSGTRSRNRQCKIGSSGRNCDGSTQQIEACEESECQACPNLPRYKHMIKECTRNDTDDSSDCILTCALGHFPPFATSSEDSWYTKFRCDPFTGYKWNTTEHSVACGAAVAPKAFNAMASMQLLEPIPCADEAVAIPQLVSKVKDVVRETCLNCNISMKLSYCGDTNRKRREIENQIELRFELDLSGYAGNASGVLDFWEFANDSLSPILTTTGSWLTVDIDGVTYVVDTANITDSAEIECGNGLFYQEAYGVCAGCVPGTWFDTSIQDCQSCPVGQYQENAGQFDCIPCPDGYTTLYTGSLDNTDCIYDKNKQEEELNIGVIIGACVGGVVLVAIIAVTVFVVKKRSSMKVTASVISVRPYSDEKRPGSVMSTSAIPIKVA